MEVTSEGFLDSLVTDQFRFSVPPREMSHGEIAGLSDAVEREFAIWASKAGFRVFSDAMVTLRKGVAPQLEKRSTNPDFVLVPEWGEIMEDGWFIELTVNNSKESRKNRQRKVMEAAGLGDRYKQLTLAQVRDRELLAELFL